ncbi:DUF3575 domain-containing protein [uncultured Winogradskyella sp.]|uniref:DUF3575 domain-containing protein n=1 Tax=uncultured Winogradskyella sp. TaxID=395353 RepID=UPI00262F3623|nr:DUF3575 domain-containing protein [uncultured Winogradskyella sp.]
MKKSIIVLLFVCSFLNVSAQDTIDKDSIDNPTSEIKLNALFMVVGAFNVSYEYLLNEESGLGLEVFIPYDEEIKDDIDFYLSPYYRMYFGNKYSSGFFLEGFGLLSTVTLNEITFFNNQGDITRTQREKETNFALGIGVGGKWYTKSGLIGELSLGVGRNLITSDFNNDFVGKLGVTIGYRF